LALSPFFRERRGVPRLLPEETKSQSFTAVLGTKRIMSVPLFTENMINGFRFITEKTGFALHFSTFPQVISGYKFVVAQEPEEHQYSRRDLKSPHSRAVNRFHSIKAHYCI
jgi:hypothetical protein